MVDDDAPLKPPVEVRRATAADAPAFLELVRALAEYERLDPPDAAARERLVRDGFGAPPRFDLWIARVEGTPCGYALAFETYSSFLALPTLYLEDLFVLPARRARGVGKALFLAVAGEARRRRCGRMEWAVLTWNEMALGFYERLGARRLEDWTSYRLTAGDLARLAGDATADEAALRGPPALP